MKRFVRDFALVFALVFVVNAAIVWLWNRLVHGAGAFDWDVTFFFAFTLGIVLALLPNGTARRRPA